MRLKLILPVVDVEKYEKPEACRYGCGGKEFWLRQVVEKPVRDSTHREVIARRYECLRCRRTFRVYPQGVNHRQFSQRAIGLAVMLYVLGLSYGAVVLMLEALGLWIGKTTVYEAVQAVAERVPGMKQTNLLEDYRTPALGADLTSVKCKGKWLPLGVTVDPLTGLTLSIDKLSGEDAQTLQAWLAPIIERVPARVLGRTMPMPSKRPPLKTGSITKSAKAMWCAIQTLCSNNSKPAWHLVQTCRWTRSVSRSNKPSWTCNV
jgi:hypothetical protein